MSPRRAATAEAGRGGRIAVTVLLVVGLAVVMLLVLRARPSTEPFDPESGRPDGTRGLVLLLREQGVTVDVVHAPPAAGDGGRVLVLDDRLDDAQRAQLTSWVDGGGVAVVADAASPLAGDQPTSPVEGEVPAVRLDAAAEANLPPGTCTIGALDALRGVFVRNGVVFTPPVGADRCFTDGGQSFAFTRQVGSGKLVVLGDNALLTNELLRYADNGPLATALLAPSAGGTVHILVGSGPAHGPAEVGSGDQTLADLVRPGVWMALIQLALAFIVFAIARGIRTGRPVDEPLPAPVEGSELVVATGQLMQRADHATRAGWVLRAEMYRELCRELRVPTITPIAELDALAARRGLTSPGEVRSALEHDVDSSTQLLDLATRLTELRDHTIGGAPREQLVP